MDEKWKLGVLRDSKISPLAGSFCQNLHQKFGAADRSKTLVFRSQIEFMQRIRWKAVWGQCVPLVGSLDLIKIHIL